jgi:putative ABC transport system permease protein
MFYRLVQRSLAARRARSALVVLSVLAGAAIASALLTTSFSVRDRMASEFRRFGPNIVVSPVSSTIEVGLPGISLGSITEQGYLNESDLWRIKALPERGDDILGYAPFLYQTVMAYAYGINAHAVLAGTWFSHAVPNITSGDGQAWTTGARRISSWGVRGSWVGGDQDLSSCMVGSAAAATLRLRAGSSLKVTYTDPTSGATAFRVLNVTGFVSTGGVEDSLIFANLRVAQELSFRPNMVHLVQVSARTASASADAIASEIEAALPSVRARSTRQLALSEEILLGRTESLVWLVCAASLGASAIGVMTVMTTGVLERRREIGVMKAVGAGRGKITALIVSEAALLGTAGGLAGYAMGLLVARYVGTGLFARTDALVPAVLPMTLGISVLAALAASALPAWRALGVPPAEVLRGD